MFLGAPGKFPKRRRVESEARLARMGGPGDLATVLALPCTRRSLGTDPRIQRGNDTCVVLLRYIIRSVSYFPLDQSKRSIVIRATRTPLPKTCSRGATHGFALWIVCGPIVHNLWNRRYKSRTIFFTQKKGLFRAPFLIALHT